MKTTALSIALAMVCFLNSGVMCYSVSNGLNYQGMEDNCILSFVVPRDKMKSSCDLDDKVKRRINAIEMKVNVYKQQMSELQSQLDKERRFNAERIEKMERQMRESMASADMSFLVERRLALLENEFSHMNAEFATGRVKSANSLHKQQRSFPFNAVDSNPVTLPNLVKSMVESEVKSVFDNFTRKFETYVREQILVYNQVFSILNKRGQTSTGPKDILQGSKMLRQSGRSHGPAEGGSILHKLENFKADLDKTGQDIAKKVERFLHKNNSDMKTNGRSDNARRTPSNGSGEAKDRTALVDSESVLNEDGLESNDSFSGENPDSNETISQETYSRTVDTDITERASSRISGPRAGNDSETAKESRHRWKENAIADENYKNMQNSENKLREEIRALLYDPLAKVMSFVENEAAAMDDKLKEQEDKNNKVMKDLTARVKSLDDSVQSNSLQVQSLSNGFQDAFVKLNKISVLESAVNEIKTNLSSDLAGMSALEFDQQNKKVKKLERLMSVYQQSLEHYKNETKHEYKEIREKLTLESRSIKKVATSLRSDVANKLDKNVDQMNRTYYGQLKEIKEQMQKNEDNIVYNQIDIEDHDIQLNDKKDRTNRDIEEVRDTVNQALFRNRECRKKIDNLQKKHSTMSDQVNVTAQAIEDLKKEVRLNLIDTWMKTNFEYDASMSNCFGDQYVRRVKTTNSKAKLVGVVLCSSDRYKILLSNSLQSNFLNIGDGRGLGEDHCEFIGATSEKNVTLAPHNPSYRTVEGYSRDKWGDPPKKTFINAFKPSPLWYECGVSIP